MIRLFRPGERNELMISIIHPQFQIEHLATKHTTSTEDEEEQEEKRVLHWWDDGVVTANELIQIASWEAMVIDFNNIITIV